MKKSIALLLFFILGAWKMQAQQVFGKNATWTFEFYEFGFFGYKTVAYEKDTLMQGLEWQKFQITGLNLVSGPNPPTGPNIAVPLGTMYLHTRNDSIFWVDHNNQIQLLFDLNAQIGDSWNFAAYDTSFNCTDSSIATVVQIAYDTLQGQPFKYMEIENRKNAAGFENSTFILPEKIYFDFGFLSSQNILKANSNMCSNNLTVASHQLRCFTQGALSLNLTNRACDHWSFVGLEEQALTKPLKVYPNPSNGIIKIDLPALSKNIQVFNSIGQLFINKEIRGLESLELDLGARAGLYLIVVELTEGSSLHSKVLLR